MPQVEQKAEKSLQKICIENICKHIDTVWCKHFIENYYKKSHYRYVIGPFDELPPSIIQEIFVFLKKKKLLRKHHLYLLISVYSKSLNFSGCDIDLNLMLQLSMERCYMLEQLIISRCMKIPKTILNNLISTLDSLVSIEAAHSNVGDDFLSSVGVYCKNLKFLDVSYTSISDRGLRTLALEQDLDSLSDNRFGQCVLLVSLKVQGCQKLTDACAADLLVSLKRLQIFDYCNTVGAIMLAMQRGGEVSFNLRSLYCTGELREEQDLCQAILVNEKAENVYLTTFPDLTEAAFLTLLELETLKELHVSNDLDENAIHFQDLCSPVLIKFSSTLVSLHLSQLNNINISAIRDQCSSLKELSLLWNLNYIHTQEDTESVSYFPSLHTAKIFSVETDPDNEGEMISNLMYGDLLSVVSSPLLQTLVASRCHNLVDAVFEESLDISNFEHLKLLELDHCHQITMDGLSFLFESSNPLEKVRFTECAQITRKDFNRYQQIVKKNKWRVEVEWS